MHALNPPIRRYALAALFAALLITGAAVGQDAPAQADLASPRATLRTFTTAMNAVSLGEAAGNIEAALACLYYDEDRPIDEQRAEREAQARGLHEILYALQYSTEALPETVDGDDFTATLGENGSSIEVVFHRWEDGNWRISSRSLTPEAFAAMRAAIADPEAEVEAAKVADERLRSPRATLETFIHGMNGTYGHTLEDAVYTLDLSWVTANVRDEVAQTYAFQLKEVLDRLRVIEFSNIPPATDGPPYVFHSESKGKIVVASIEDAELEGARVWRFSKATLESLDALYRKYSAYPSLVGGGVSSTAGLPLNIRVRTWVYRSNIAFLTQEFLYLEIYQWLGLFIVIFLGMLVSKTVTLSLIWAVRKRFREHHFRLDQRIEQDFVRPIRITLMAWVWLLGLSVIGLPVNVLDKLKIAAQVTTAIGIVWAIYILIDIVGRYMAAKASRTANKFDDLIVPIVTKTAKIFAAVIALVVISEQAGQDTTKMLAGLGLGGLAVALAAKDVVANVFGSMTILLDRPFQLGDWVTFGNVDGSIESVGIRSTRVRTFYNSVITVPNSELTNQCIDNMGARRYRRIKTTLSLAYDTPPGKIEAFCEGVRELIRQHPYTRKDYFHVYFNEYSASSLDILVYCFVETPEWGTELREKHRLFTDILRLANSLGVEFAFPTQTMYVRPDEAPRHEDLGDAEAALQRGRNAAGAIVEEFLGDGVKPPPVSFGPTPAGARKIDDKQIGEAGDGGE